MRGNSVLWNLFELTWQQPPVRFRGARASDARPGFRAELERRVLRVPQRRRRPLHAAASLALIQELVDAARNAGAAQAYVLTRPTSLSSCQCPRHEARS